MNENRKTLILILFLFSVLALTAEVGTYLTISMGNKDSLYIFLSIVLVFCMAIYYAVILLTTLISIYTQNISEYTFPRLYAALGFITLTIIAHKIIAFDLNGLSVAQLFIPIEIIPLGVLLKVYMKQKGKINPPYNFIRDLFCSKKEKDHLGSSKERFFCFLLNFITFRYSLSRGMQ